MSGLCQEVPYERDPLLSPSPSHALDHIQRIQSKTLPETSVNCRFALTARISQGSHGYDCWHTRGRSVGLSFGMKQPDTSGLRKLACGVRLSRTVVAVGAALVWADLSRAQPSDSVTHRQVRAASVKADQPPILDVEDEVVIVDIRADVRDAVLTRIRALGGTVLSSVPQNRAIRARLPLSALEPLAMREIVHDLAHGAELFFATGINGSAQMVPNMTNLCAAGADVIVDDIGYLGAPAFQDGVAARAVSAAAANGGDRLQAVAASDDTETPEADPEVVDLSITGPSDNRVDMVFVGDDYAEDEMDTFATDVDRIRGDLFTISPFREYRGYFNVRRIDLAAGQNQLSGTHARQKAALEHLEPDQHEILMLVRKSGSAGLSWTLSWVDSEGNSRWTGVAYGMAVARWAHKIFAHEIGHSFAWLEDEYDGKCGNGPNISATGDRETLKWAHWIGVDGYGGTDLDPEETPVPASRQMYSYYLGRTVSAYQCPNGNWRPTWKSIMRYLAGAGERFDPVSREQIIKRFHAFVRPMDRALPEEDVVTPTSCDPVGFEVQVPDVDTVATTWRIDGDYVGSGRHLQVWPCTLELGTRTIEVDVADETRHVRARERDWRMQPVSESWTLNVNVFATAATAATAATTAATAATTATTAATATTTAATATTTATTAATATTTTAAATTAATATTTTATATTTT